MENIYTYKLVKFDETIKFPAPEGTIKRTRIADGFVTWFPPSEENGDYRRYLAWVAEGNTAEPADE